MVSGKATLSPPARTKDAERGEAAPGARCARSFCKASAARASRSLHTALGIRATAAPRRRRSPRKAKPRRRGRSGSRLRDLRDAWDGAQRRRSSSAKWPRKLFGLCWLVWAAQRWVRSRRVPTAPGAKSLHATPTCKLICPKYCKHTARHAPCKPDAAYASELKRLPQRWPTDG